MIHDAQVEVTCDGCSDSVYIGLHYVYSGAMGTQGRYNDDESAIEQDLQTEGWIVREGKHYCSEECARVCSQEAA